MSSSPLKKGGGGWRRAERCHGPSVRHTEDENIGATPPDVVFKKGKVDRICGECHDPEEHTILTGKTRRARLAEG